MSFTMRAQADATRGRDPGGRAARGRRPGHRARGGEWRHGRAGDPARVRLVPDRGRRRLPDGRLAHRLLDHRHVRGQAHAGAGNDARARHGALRGVPRRRVRDVQDDVHLHGALRRRDRAPRPLPPPDHRRRRCLRRRARGAELHRRGRRQPRLLPVLGQHPARPQGRIGRRATSRRRSRLAWPGRRRGARPRPPSPRPASRWRSAAPRRPPRSVPPA